MIDEKNDFVLKCYAFCDFALHFMLSYLGFFYVKDTEQSMRYFFKLFNYLNGTVSAFVV